MEHTVVHSWTKGEKQEVRVVLAREEFRPERLHLRYFSNGFPTRRGVTIDATLEDLDELVRGAVKARDVLAGRTSGT